MAYVGPSIGTLAWTTDVLQGIPNTALVVEQEGVIDDCRIVGAALAALNLAISTSANLLIAQIAAALLLTTSSSAPHRIRERAGSGGCLEGETCLSLIHI